MTTTIEIQVPSLASSIFIDARDQTIPGSLSLAPGDGKKRDPGNEVEDFSSRSLGDANYSTLYSTAQM